MKVIFFMAVCDSWRWNSGHIHHIVMKFLFECSSLFLFFSLIAHKSMPLSFYSFIFFSWILAPIQGDFNRFPWNSPFCSFLLYYGNLFKIISALISGCFIHFLCTLFLLSLSHRLYDQTSPNFFVFFSCRCMSHIAIF